MNAYLAACYGKAVFPSRRTARRCARHIRGTGGPLLKPYRCRWCGAIHVGHTPGNATHLRAGPHGPIHVKDLAT